MNQLEQKGKIFILITLLSLVMIFPVSAQDETVVVRVGYRELQIIPENTEELASLYTPFISEIELNELVSDNDSLFWESLGQYGSNFSIDQTVSTFSIVQINDTGFYQTLIGLSSDNQTFLWMEYIDSDICSNFSVVVESATGFFAADNHYWGLSEEIIVLPGTFVGQSDIFVWSLSFHLVAESELWSLLISTSGEILSSSVESIPCRECTDWTSLIVFISLAGSIVIFGILILLNNRRVKGILN